MPWMTGGGQPIPAGLSYPPPKTLEPPTSKWMIFNKWGFVFGGCPPHPPPPIIEGILSNRLV